MLNNAWGHRVPKQAANPKKPKTVSKTHKAPIRSVMTNLSQVLVVAKNNTTSSFNLQASHPRIIFQGVDVLEQQVAGQKPASSRSGTTSKSMSPPTQVSNLPHYCRTLNQSRSSKKLSNCALASYFKNVNASTTMWWNSEWQLITFAKKI